MARVEPDGHKRHDNSFGRHDFFVPEMKMKSDVAVQTY